MYKESYSKYASSMNRLSTLLYGTGKSGEYMVTLLLKLLVFSHFFFLTEFFL